MATPCTKKNAKNKVSGSATVPQFFECVCRSECLHLGFKRIYFSSLLRQRSRVLPQGFSGKKQLRSMCNVCHCPDPAPTPCSRQSNVIGHHINFVYTNANTRRSTQKKHGTVTQPLAQEQTKITIVILNIDLFQQFHVGILNGACRGAQNIHEFRN